MAAILIYHDDLDRVDRDKAVAATEQQQTTSVSLDAAADLLTGDKLSNVDWEECRRREEVFYEANIAPLLAAQPSAEVIYFGAAPIPLAARLGFLVGTWRDTNVRLQHHIRKDWQWAAETPPLALIRTTVQPNKGEGDVILRVGISQAVDVSATLELLPTPIGEIDISVEEPHVDIIQTPTHIDQVVTEFRRALDEIGTKLPNARAIHLFAAVPVGLAFKLGAAVNPTTTAPLHLYQYDRNASPRFTRCFELQGATSRSAPALSDAERSAASRLRLAWQEQIEKLREQAKTEAPHEQWLREHGGRCPEIQRLPPLRELSLITSRVMPTTAVDGGFSYDELKRQWHLDDSLLANFDRRLTANDDAARAARLFLLHETVHHDSQNLTSSTAAIVGRFAKVLESIDYYADVYAILHEYDFATRRNSIDHTVGQRFAAIVEVALETFWAFDDTEPADRMQVRRVHRYLIWYWQLLRLARATNEASAFQILATRPFIELAGPRQQTTRERTYFLFDRAPDGPLEIALISEGRLFRYANGPAANITSMIRGFQQRDGALVRHTMKGIVDTLP